MGKLVIGEDVSTSEFNPEARCYFVIGAKVYLVNSVDIIELNGNSFVWFGFDEANAVARKKDNSWSFEDLQKNFTDLKERVGYKFADVRNVVVSSYQKSVTGEIEHSTEVYLVSKFIEGGPAVVFSTADSYL